MAEWGSEPIWTPFEEINGGQQFSKQFGAQDLNALAENIAYLYKNRPEEDTTAIASDVVAEKTFYSEGKKQTGTMPMLRSLDSDAISIVANTNSTAPNGTLDIYVLSDHKTYVPESVGDGSYAAQIVEPNAVPENIAEGITLFGIQGTHKGGITTPTQEKSVTITENGTTEVVADDGYAMSKVTAIVNVPIPETPIFDGTINIESGNTTISGSYVIDESKAFDLLSTYGKVKTFNVNFGAGGPANGGDEINFTSMTFDGTNGLIKYNDKGAFAMNGGFAEYTANYGDGNGARVNFEEGTECRKEFKELFLSIADEYVEEEAESLVGTWVFNTTMVYTPPFSASINFTSFDDDFEDYVNFTSITLDTSGDFARLLYDDVQVAREDVGFYTDSWKTITITSEPTDTTFITWLKANATKQGAASLISFTIAGTSYQAEEGMTWGEWIESEYNTDGVKIDSSGNVLNSGGQKIATAQYSGDQTSTDIIVANTSYVVQQAGGAD